MLKKHKSTSTQTLIKIYNITVVFAWNGCNFLHKTNMEIIPVKLKRGGTESSSLWLATLSKWNGVI